jgi:hypothetical protein
MQMSPQDPPGDQIVDLVGSDIEECFKPLLTRLDGFQVARPFSADDNAVSNGRLSALAWEWSGRDETGFNGLGATNQDITVRGVTIVEFRDDAETLYHRYIDWNDVAAQLGLATVGRTSVPDLLPTDT